MEKPSFLKMPPIMDKLQKIPPKTRIIGFFSLVVALVVLFIWQVHMDKMESIRKLNGSIIKLEDEIRQNQAKLDRLAELKVEVKNLQERLTKLKEQLPAESEVSSLLREIQGLVNRSGLSLKLWRPERRRPGKENLYEEIPITLKLTGGYHNVGLFFDNTSKLTRIVNVQNVKMEQPKIGKSGMVEVNIDCMAVTFAAIEKPAAAAPKAAKVAR